MVDDDERRITDENLSGRDGDRRGNIARARREFTASINSCDGASSNKHLRVEIKTQLLPWCLRA